MTATQYARHLESCLRTETAGPTDEGWHAEVRTPDPSILATCPNCLAAGRFLPRGANADEQVDATWTNHGDDYACDACHVTWGYRLPPA